MRRSAIATDDQAIDTSAPIEQLDLAGLLCSRLCHDLLSPIGALGNGLELLADETDPVMRQRCLELLEQSARASSARLAFFRIAFGPAGTAGETVPAGEVRSLVAGLAGERIELDWAIGDQPLPRIVAKVLLNLALIGIEALARGGSLELGAETGEEASEIVVRASGPKLAFDPALGEALEGADDSPSSRTAPAAMLHRLATTAGGGLQYALDDEALVLGAVLPVA